MKKIILGTLIGTLAASACYLPLLIHEREARYALGKYNGYTSGLIDAARTIHEEFGVYDGTSDYRRLFSVKTTDVIVIEQTNGCKVIRVIP